MKKGIIVGACIASLSMVSGVNAAQIQFDNDGKITGVESMKNESLKTAIEKNKHILKKITISPNYEYNSKHFFTKKFSTPETGIPANIEKRISKVELVLKKEDGNSELINSILGKSGPISSEKYDIAKKVLQIEYKPSHNYVYKTSDLVDIDALENANRRSHFGSSLKLLVTFDTGDTLFLGDNGISFNTKEQILRRSLYNEENEFKDFYANINEDLIRTYLNKKYENMPREAYKEKLKKMYRGIEKLNRTQKESAKKLYASIQKESDFANYKDKYEKIISTKNLIQRLAGAINGQIKTLEAYNIIDSLED